MRKSVSFKTLINNDKITYRIIRFLQNTEAVNLMQTSKFVNEKIAINKGIYKNLIKSSSKE